MKVIKYYGQLKKNLSNQKYLEELKHKTSELSKTLKHINFI